MDVGPKRLAMLLEKLAGIEASPNPSLIHGSVDQSPYAIAQLYQFLVSGGEIQTLPLVRGVPDREGRMLKRYDKAPRHAQPGDPIAVRLKPTPLHHQVRNGTASTLAREGLRCQDHTR